MEAAAKKQLKEYFVIGRAEETEETTAEGAPIKNIMYLAASDLTNVVYESWCTKCLCFDAPLNVEHLSLINISEPTRPY